MTDITNLISNTGEGRHERSVPIALGDWLWPTASLHMLGTPGRGHRPVPGQPAPDSPGPAG